MEKVVAIIDKPERCVDCDLFHEYKDCDTYSFEYFCTYMEVSMDFNKCDLTRSYFYKTSLKGVDFSTCNINDIIIPSELLKGIKVNALQAAELAKLLGLIIVDDY